MGIRQSMGRAGSALDNAGIESWHSTLEFELRSVQRFATRADAPGAVAAWIDDYNRHRRHSALQMSSPVDFELGPQAPGAGSRPDMVPPSSPWSRPNPPVGSGWPSARLDPGCGRRRSATVGNRPFQDQIPPTQVSTVSGDCRPPEQHWAACSSRGGRVGLRYARVSGELGELCPAKRCLEERPPEGIAHHPLQRPVLIDL